MAETALTRSPRGITALPIFSFVGLDGVRLTIAGRRGADDNGA